ncbi:MAG TPA: ABC transporter ATP-binding protein [Actinomycetota bacterium]|nr:ABC transporter ATP-binding protein [Actinomycetota bacterium]
MSLAVDIEARRATFTVAAAFNATAGETVALLGPNGAGKSTLVAALAGIEPPARGRVDLDGRTLDDVAAGRHVPPERRPVGVVFQNRLLFPHLSAIENVAFPLRALGAGRREARSRAADLLARLGLAPRAGARPAELSGGEAQRVALARALIREPRLLLLDEPLAALDVRARTQVRALLRRELIGFPGVRLLVTHDPVEAMSMADRMVLMEEGRVTQIGTPTEVRAAPRTSYAAELVGVNLFTGRLERLEAGAGRLVTAEGDVVVGWPLGIDSSLEPVIGLLRPADVSLHVRPPEGASARNVLAGTVTSVSVEGERARVRIDAAPPLVAEVTLGSVERLGIREGTRLWASFKAVEVRVQAI